MPRRVGAHSCVRAFICTFCCVPAGIQFWSNVMLQLFYRWLGIGARGCASRLFAVKTDWRALGRAACAVEEPLGNGGEPSPPPRWGLA